MASLDSRETTKTEEHKEKEEEEKKEEMEEVKYEEKKERREQEGEGEKDEEWKEEKEEEEEDDGVPYDKGWAWAVAIGCFINYALYSGYIKCCSLFYVELIHRFEASATETALFFSIRTAMLGIGSLVVMNVVVGHLGERRTVMIGGVLMSISGILPSLANDMTTIIWLQGVCLGLGQSMLISPGEVLMGKYFRKKRALVFPLAKCGASIGGVLAPLLITFFLETYALSGTLLLTGALCMHSLPAALLFRPLSHFTNRTIKRTPSKMSNFTQKDKTPESTQALMTTNDFQTNIKKGKEMTSVILSSSLPDLVCSTAEQVTSIIGMHSSLSELSKPHNIDPKCALVDSKPRGIRTESPSDVTVVVLNSASSLYHAGRSCEHKGEEKTTSESVSSTQETRQRFVSCPIRCRFVFDFSLFRSPLFRLLLCYFVLFNMVNCMGIYLPALASENSITESQNGVLLSIIGGLDLLGRISCAFIGNSGLLRVPTLIIISNVLLGVASQFVRFLTSFHHFLALSVMLGLLGAPGNTLLPLLVMEFVGIDRLPKALGFVFLTLAASASASFPLLGYIRDVTGSYVAVYHVIGVGAILAAGFLCCEKWVRRLEK